MSATLLADVSEQVQKFWSPIFMDELRESLLLGSLVNKEYQGEIKALNDTVYVSQINAAEGELRTAGVDADSFTSEKLTTSRIGVSANKRAVASFEMEQLVDLQSQIGAQQSKIREALLFGAMKQINTYLYSKVAPSSAAPDHILSGSATMDASKILEIRMAASKAKWLKDSWYLLMDPSYYNDVLNATTLTSGDYVDDKAVVGGQVVTRRFGFNMIEDNSDGILTLSPASAGAECGLAFHPDFLHLVMQTQPAFKVSDLHSNNKFGYLISVDLIFGAELGIAGSKKHIQIYNT